MSQYPVVEGVAGWTSPAEGQSHGPVALPSGIAAGELLLCLCAAKGETSASAGWTKLGPFNVNFYYQVGSVFWRVATGDANDVLTITKDDSSKLSTLVYRISGASAVSGEKHLDYGDTVDAPAHALDTPQPALWIYFHAGKSGQLTKKAPSGYSDLRTQPGANDYEPAASAAWKTATAASDDPPETGANKDGYGHVWTLAVTNPPKVRLALPGPLGAPAIVIADPAALLSLPGPLALDPALRLASLPVTLASTIGPLATPAAIIWEIPAQRLTLSGPLGSALVSARLPLVATVTLPGPLGAPRLRLRHRAPITNNLTVTGPLGAVRLLAQQRFAVDLPTLPEAVGDARQRLLSDPFPLRRSVVLPEYREDAILPWVYGRATLKPLALDADGLRWLVADHPVVEVTAVRDEGITLDGWELVQQLDATQHPIALLRLTRPPKGTLSVDVAGRRHPETGALLEHPAEIAEDLLGAAGWRVPHGAFDTLRDTYPSVVLGGVLDAAQTVREAVSRVLGSVDADWCASPLRAWLPEPGAPIARLDATHCGSASAEATHAGLCTRLRVSYGHDWSAGEPRGALTVTATDRLAELGEIDADLDLPWVRTARDALTLASAALARRARPRWTFSLRLPLGGRIYRPGDSIELDYPWLPRGRVIVIQTDRDQGGQTLTASRHAGDAVRCELTGRGALIDATGAEPIRVAYKDGVATFTILNELGDPLAGASVTLDGGATRTTDRNGQVRFATTRGAHTLLVVANGYVDLQAEVVI